MTEKVSGLCNLLCNSYILSLFQLFWRPPLCGAPMRCIYCIPSLAPHIEIQCTICSGLPACFNSAQMNALLSNLKYAFPPVPMCFIPLKEELAWNKSPNCKHRLY